DIPRVVKEAFYLAQTGRPGPVLIDIPKNIQQARTQPVFPNAIEVRGYDPSPRAGDLALNEIIGLIEKSERPVLYIGGGIISGNGRLKRNSRNGTSKSRNGNSALPSVIASPKK